MNAMNTAPKRSANGLRALSKRRKIARQSIAKKAIETVPGPTVQQLAESWLNYGYQFYLETCFTGALRGRKAGT
jgi:hypothetical protein